MSSRFCPTCKRTIGGHTPLCPYDGTALVAPPRPTNGLEGKLVAGRYRVLKKLGEGGMGEVFLAQHEAIEKRVALKVLRAEYSQKQDVVARFQLEAKSASRIKHPNVVDIFDFGQTEDGRFFLAMEYLEGHDLADELHQVRVLEPERAVHIMAQVCAALGTAHAAGVVHRDMKPENVFLQNVREGVDEVKIVDFGIARMREIGEGVGEPQVEGERRLTKAGSVFGTPEYMAPEQATGKDADQSVDIYAVGVMLFEVLTGKVPFTGDSMLHTLTLHVHQPPPTLRKVNPTVQVSPDLESVVMQALAKSPAHRFETMEDFVDAMRMTPEGASILPPPPRRRVPRSVPSGDISPLSGSTQLTITVSDPASDRAPPAADAASQTGERASEAPLPLITRARPSAEQLDFDDAPESQKRPPSSRKPAPAPSRLPLFVGAGAVALAAVAGGGWLLLRGSTRASAAPLAGSAPPAASPASPPASPASPAITPAPARVEPPAASTAAQPSAPAAQPTAPAASATIVLHVVSDPPGALVRKGAFQVCDSTPCDVMAEPNEAVELSLEKTDWHGGAKVLAQRSQTVTVRLAKRGPLPGGKSGAGAAQGAAGASGRSVAPVPMCEVMEGDLKILRPCK